METKIESVLFQVPRRILAGHFHLGCPSLTLSIHVRCPGLGILDSFMKFLYETLMRLCESWL